MDMILMVGLMPLVFWGIVLIVHYIRFDVGKLQPLARNFGALANEANEIMDCKKENIFAIEKMFVEDTPSSIIKSWEFMKEQIARYYGGEFVPEGKAFFNFSNLVEIDGNRRGVRTLGECFWVFGVLALSLPVAVSLWTDNTVLIEALGVGMGAFVGLALLWLMFTLADENVFWKAQKGYSQFMDSFNRVVPVAPEETAFIFESAGKNERTFQEAANKITRKLDDFANEMVLPVLQDSLKVITDRQEQGMSAMTSDFAKHLTDVMDTRMASLSKTIKGIQVELNVVKDGLSENVSGLNHLLIAQRTLLEESTHKLILSGETQAKAVTKAEEIQNRSMKSGELLIEHLEGFANTVDRLAEQNNKFSLETVNMIKESGQTQQQISDQLKQSQDSLENSVRQATGLFEQLAVKMEEVIPAAGKEIALGAADILKAAEQTQKQIFDQLKQSQDNLGIAVRETTGLFDGIIEKMDQAMATAGIEIAKGIKEATGDNAEAIEKLAEKSALLRDDYDNYFSRIDTYTKSAYEDMDYAVGNVIARISEEADKMLKENSQENHEVLDKYRESTTDLLLAFREQTNNISLYAKEINMDVNELSENLKTSVDVFNQSLQGGVESTLKDFDKGLAELSLRIANTVESISDAVEGLPAALGKR